MRFIQTFLLFLAFPLFITGLVGKESYAAVNVEKEAADSYRKGDYATTVKLLEDHLLGLEQKIRAEGMVNRQEVVRKYLMLGHVLSWRVNNYEDAVMAYERAMYHSKADARGGKGPEMGSIFVAADIVILQMLAPSFVSTLEWNESLERQDAAAVIQRTPADFCNMFFDLTRISLATTSHCRCDNASKKWQIATRSIIPFRAYVPQHPPHSPTSPLQDMGAQIALKTLPPVV